MTALNSLEILKKFFGNNSTPGIALEMVRNGLFEEQLKLASQWGQSAQEKPPKEDSLPMIKKTLPVGPLVPVQTPEQTNAAQREEKPPADSASPTSNAASAPPSGASEKPTSEPTGREVPSANAPPTGQKQTPSSGEHQPADENQSSELADLGFSEDSSGSAEEGSAGMPASALLKETSPKEEPKTEETSDENFPAVAVGEGTPLLVAPAQAPIPSEPAGTEDQSPTEQASSAPPVEANHQHSGTLPKGPVPGPFPADLLPGKETFSESRIVSPPASPGSEQTGQSTATGSQTPPNASGPAIPPGLDPLAGTPQAVAVSTPAAPSVSEGASAGGGRSAVSGSVSAVGSENASGVGHAADRGGVSSSAANPTKAKPAAAPEGSSQEAGVQRVRFVQRVARAFQSLQDGGGSVRLRLHPPELGSLRVELIVREGAMRARMEVENASARTTLLEHLPMLRERLAQQDIRIEQFEVEIGGQSGGGSSHQSDNPAAEQRNASFSPPSNRSRPAEPGGKPTGANPLAASESTKLNVVI